LTNFGAVRISGAHSAVRAHVSSVHIDAGKISVFCVYMELHLRVSRKAAWNFESKNVFWWRPFVVGNGVPLCEKSLGLWRREMQLTVTLVCSNVRKFVYRSVEN